VVGRVPARTVHTLGVVAEPRDRVREHQDRREPAVTVRIRIGGLYGVAEPDPVSRTAPLAADHLDHRKGRVVATRPEPDRRQVDQFLPMLETAVRRGDVHRHQAAGRRKLPVNGVVGQPGHGLLTRQRRVGPVVHRRVDRRVVADELVDSVGAHHGRERGGDERRTAPPP
jgi:hypothetical protein